MMEEQKKGLLLYWVAVNCGQHGLFPDGLFLALLLVAFLTAGPFCRQIPRAFVGGALGGLK